MWKLNKYLYPSYNLFAQPTLQDCFVKIKLRKPDALNF